MSRCASNSRRARSCTTPHTHATAKEGYNACRQPNGRWRRRTRATPVSKVLLRNLVTSCDWNAARSCHALNAVPGTQTGCEQRALIALPALPRERTGLLQRVSQLDRACTHIAGGSGQLRGRVDGRPTHVLKGHLPTHRRCPRSGDHQLARGTPQQATRTLNSSSAVAYAAAWEANLREELRAAPISCSAFST